MPFLSALICSCTTSPSQKIYFHAALINLSKVRPEHTETTLSGPHLPSLADLRRETSLDGLDRTTGAAGLNM